MVTVSIRELTKKFGKVIAVNNVTLDINHGEFMVLVGPSGCGKTTLLRLIAGLEVPDHGRILFDGEDVTDLPPYKRDTGMVFQNYALWPHMTVFENIAYGLRIRKVPRNEIKKRVKWALELVKLEGLEDRYPHELSGGQQQRVALARALVVQPKVLLLDEPLSNLDAKLRVEMREEIRRLQKELGITTIYVTHDQEEALTIADRIAVMNMGQIIQVGTPYEVYRRPRNLFVASFLGRCTILWGKVLKVSRDYITVESEGHIFKGIVPSNDIKVHVEEGVALVIRPEDVSLEGDASSCNIVRGVVDWISFSGDHLDVKVKINNSRILLTLDADADINVGERMTIYIPYDSVLILPAKGVYEVAYAKEL
ncbi:MAG: ABC transporter ATP-binding protein [Thermoprotei archaeon]|nr:MAG: ABC transporter ATP-binding protein [Thermoprotei archaeon]RLF20674.1 MAG: ABC transporter ATP-binding protein [Thermoprotei archaeon]